MGDSDHADAHVRPRQRRLPAPAVACRALHDLVRQEAVPPQTACGCVPGFAVPTVIAGRVDGNRFSLTLGACGLCGLAPRAGRDMQILTPT